MRKTDNEILLEYTNNLEIKLGREIVPKDVIHFGKDPKSPYHKHLTWDKAKGFQKNLLNEARHLLASIKIKVISEGGEVVTRAKVRVLDGSPRNSTLPGGYSDRRTVLNTVQLNREMVRMSIRSLELWKRQYVQFGDAAFPEIDAAILKLKIACGDSVPVTKAVGVS